MPRLKELYRDQLVPTLKKELGYRNVMQVPRLEKIVVNVGLGEALQNAKALDAAVQDITTITGQRPIDLFTEEQSLLRPLPVEPYDVAVIKPARVSRQFRVTVDTNHYSVPAQLAGVRVIVKLYPDRICIYHEDKLVARHVRSYDRRKDYEHPDHPRILLEQRKKARRFSVKRSGTL